VETQQQAQETIWLKDRTVMACMHCADAFTVINRRHHCRKCGGIYCGDCAPKRDLPKYGYEKTMRMCHFCFKEIQQKFQSGVQMYSLKQSDKLQK